MLERLHLRRRAVPERGVADRGVEGSDPGCSGTSPYPPFSVPPRRSVFGTLGLNYLGRGAEPDPRRGFAPYARLDVLTGGEDTTLPAGWRKVAPEEMKAPPKPTLPVALGQRVRAKLDKNRVDGVFRGTDFKGRPLIEVSGKLRTLSFDSVEPRAGKAKGPHTAYEGLFEIDGILRPPPAVGQFLVAALEQKVVGNATAIDCMRWLRDRGHEVYLVGGGVRDLLREHKRNPSLSAERAMEFLQDIDLVGTATAREAAQMFHALNPAPNTTAAPTKRGGIFGYFEQLGIVMAGGPKGGEPKGKGLDYAQMKITDFTGPAVLNEDTGERTVPVTFGPSLSANAYWRDSKQNSLYFDPFNKVVLDPTGSGVKDAQKGMFRYVHRVAADEPTVFLRFWKFRLRGHHSDAENTRATLDNAERNLSKIPGQLVGFGAYEMYSMSAGYPSAKEFLKDLKRVIHEDERFIGDRTDEKSPGLYERHFEPVEKELCEFLDKLKADGGPSPFEKFKELLV